MSGSMLVYGVHVDSGPTSLLEEVLVHCYFEALQRCLGWGSVQDGRG